MPPAWLKAYAALYRGSLEDDRMCLCGILAAEALIGHDLFDTAAKSAEVRRWFAREAELAAQTHGHAGENGHAHHHDVNRHGDDIAAFAILRDQPLDWQAFGLWLSMLLNRHGEKVLRVKGILNIEGEPAPVAIHGVQHLVHPPVHMTHWPDGDRRTRIVFIGQRLDRAAVERSFAVFVEGAGGKS